jgi:hypothetical protein
MKQYLIDEIRPDEHHKIRTYLEETYGAPELGNLFWVPLEAEILSAVQAEHSDCQPFYFAIELEETSLHCELLVRTRNRMRCNCIAYANRTQRNWFIDCIDQMFESLGIKT